jgi:hypothetical protein
VEIERGERDIGAAKQAGWWAGYQDIFKVRLGLGEKER